MQKEIRQIENLILTNRAMLGYQHEYERDSELSRENRENYE